MRQLKKWYNAAVYIAFFLLFFIVYSHNVTSYALSPRACAAAVVALLGMLINLAIVARVLSAGESSKIVTGNAVVSAWVEHGLSRRQQYVSAIVNISSMAVFVLALWFFREIFAGLFIGIAVLGYEASELLRARHARIEFALFSFSVPVFVFIIVFLLMFLTSGLK